MIPKLNLTHSLSLFAAVLILAFTSGSILKKFVYSEKDQARIQHALTQKFTKLDQIAADILSQGIIPDPSVTDKKGLLLLLYLNDSLIYWSGNGISSFAMDTLRNDTTRFSFISNTWYIIRKYCKDDTTLIGLLKVKSVFPWQNEYLQNGFQKDLKVPFTTQISLSPQSGSANLRDWQGNYLFSLDFGQAMKYPNLTRYVPPILYLLALLLLLLVVTEVFKRISNGFIRNLLFLFTALLFIAGRWLQVKYLFPGAVYNLELFGPFLYAGSPFMSSLGDVLLNSILLLFLTFRFCRDFYFGNLTDSSGNRKLYVWIILLLLLFSGYFVWTHYIFSSLILNSSINFETFNVAGLTVYTFIGLLTVAFFLTGLLLLSDRILTLATGKIKTGKILLAFTVIYGLFLLILYLIRYHPDLISFAGFYLGFILLCLIYSRRPVAYTYSTLLVFVFLFSVFSVYFIARNSAVKEKNNMKVLAENLAAEHDPVAEYLLERLNRKLENDSVLAMYLFDLRYSKEEIFNHLQDNYFNGFWGKYLLRFTDCKPHDSLILRGPDKTVQNCPCYDFFDAMIQEKGVQLSGTNFYFIDTLNGRINYVGRIKYVKPAEKQEVTLFLELESRLIAEELGYPKLLIEGKYSKGDLLQEYSYAKYYKDSLIARSGVFQYSRTFDYFRNNNYEDQGYDHLIVRIDKDNAIVVSKSSPTFFARMVSFSYIFVFYYFLVLFYLAFRYLTGAEKGFEFNFRNKIQFSILSVLLLSLLLIGGGTIYFSIEQYKKKQHDILSEKIQSVYVEIDHKLAYVTHLTPGWSGEDYDNLGQLLLKFSDVFYTDINLYDPSGNLLATSRPEIFDRGLQGEKMNPVAFRKMDREKQAEFVHREKIGSLSYLSAYVPYLNVENKLLAYLNLPYFSRQDVMSKDISTLTVAIINVYVLLILATIAIAVFISEQITRPLRLIRQKFSEIKLGKQYEPIHYQGKDEIGSLVAEYNRMVTELERSVEMLAKSERESAWREMAKQIAHEIKNPLTPMKLSVQQLRRAWVDRPEDFNRHLESVSHTLIEQIDNLSSIASEFSNFAKMPRAVSERINLAERIRSTLQLFPSTDHISFSFVCNDENICIMADKEQISRVFINLIKNAVQSIPENKAGKVRMNLEAVNDKAVFTISDNGKGIPDELLDKLFTPNFTTKSSGMGLGLAIAKNIVETCNGTITFQTDIKHGTTFRIEIPLCPEI
jgi:two-component system nitrogen regulation sensor histidine kinase NtrY